MANFNATQEVTIWNDDGSNPASVGDLTTAALGLNTAPLGVYFSSDPTLIDTNVYPLRVSASGNLLTESAVHATDLDIRDLNEAQDDIRIYSASGSPSHEVYFTEPQETMITDPDGNIVNVNADGSLQVTFATGGSSITRMIELRFFEIFPLDTVLVWEDVLEYTVPDGYSLELIDFSTSAGNATSSARAATKLQLGTYDLATDVYTDVDTYTSPYFGASIEATVQTVTTGPTVLTITYINHLGVTGRTATVAIPAGSIIGQAFNATLQTGDYGVLDVTDVTSVGGTVGLIHIDGVVVVFTESMTETDQTYHQITSRESIIIGPGESVGLGVMSSQKAGVPRYIHVLGQLRSIVED